MRASPAVPQPPGMPRKPHREAFEESNRRLRLRFLLSTLAVGALAVWMQVTMAGEALEPGDLVLGVVMAAVGGAGATVLALILGGLCRWQTLPLAACRAASVAVALAGLGLAAYAVVATDAAPRNPLGIAEERHTGLYLAGLLALAFGVANRPPPANLG